LYLCLKNLSLWFLTIASRGQGQPNLNTDIIKAAWIPIPPLKEQEDIVAKVDELMALCDHLKASLATQLNLADSPVEQAIA
jgi:type I restriction enzyme S subunit